MVCKPNVNAGALSHRYKVVIRINLIYTFCKCSGTNYSIGCFHITLTYVYGIKFISEKNIGLREEVLNKCKETPMKTQYIQLICEKDRLVPTCVCLLSGSFRPLWLYRERLSWTVKWGVAVIYFFQVPALLLWRKAERSEVMEKNLHFVLAFLSTFSHLKKYFWESI